MKALVVVSHPSPESFSHALADAVRRTWASLGCDVAFYDLYLERFQPLLTAEEHRGAPSLDPVVQAHIARLRESDLLAVVHPNCWGAPPAMMKGWIDRVFAEEAAFTFAKGTNQGDEPIGLLKMRAALVLNTGNTVAEREQNHFGDPLDRMWRRCILNLCGVQEVSRALFGVVTSSSPDQRANWLQQAEVMARDVHQVAARTIRPQTQQSAPFR
jgi:NAD(P)H dehydrogenase (quinone)